MRWFKSPVDTYLPSPKVDAFVDEIHALYRKHGFCLSHEDSQGAFIISKFTDDADFQDLDAAHVDSTIKPKEA